MAAPKKPEEAAARPAQPSEGSILPLSLGAHNSALRAEIEVLRGVIDALLPFAPGREQEKQLALAKVLSPEPLPEDIIAWARDAVRELKPQRGRPKKHDDAKLLLQVEYLRAFYAAREGRPYTDRQALVEAVIEHRLMAPPRSMSRWKAERLLTSRIGDEGKQLRRQIHAMVKAVQAERRQKNSGR